MIDNNFFLEEDEDGFTLKDAITDWVSLTKMNGWKVIILPPSYVFYGYHLPEKYEKELIRRFIIPYP